MALWSKHSVESVLSRAFVVEAGDRTEIKLRRESEQPKTVWTDAKYNAEAYGTDLVNSIIGKKFPYPKSLYAEADCLFTAVREKKDALVIDFFAGSGTTLNAINLLNAGADGGMRRCILITNNEVSDEDAKVLAKKGDMPGDSDWEQHGICQSVTWPRSKYTILGKRDDGTELEGKYIIGKPPSCARGRDVLKLNRVHR